MSRKFILACVFFILAGLNANIFAQYRMDSPVPMDPKVRTGKLPNGLTYYVRHNAEPKERASFYIIQNVGAILENDDQNGLAHFLEHMAFNGTKHFPGRKGLINVLEKYGIEFGRDINAYTAQDETVYNIDNVPTNNTKLMDSCLLILHDWSHYLTLDDKEIDIERPVILEEWRTRRNANFRMQAQFMPILLNNSKYAYRDVIGNWDIIENFKYQTLRDFYQQWYRPDLQAIAVVGDFDAIEMEKKIIDLFSKIPAPVNPTPRFHPEIPPHDGVKFVVATDKELTQSSVQIYIKFPGVPEEEKNHAYVRNHLIRNFYNTMLRQRISEILQKSNPPFINASAAIGGLIGNLDTYFMSATAKPNEEALALEAVYRENERVKRFGFNNSELERAKTNMLVALESASKEQDKTPTEAYIGEIKDHFMEGEPMPDFNYYHTFVKTVLPTITVEEVSALAKEYLHHQNMVIMITGPSEGVTHITEEEALATIAKVEQSTLEPYQDEVSGSSLIEGELPGSKIVSIKKLPQFDAEEWTLANGAKVVFKKADFEKDQVKLSSFSWGGNSLYDVNKLPSASVASSFVAAYGVGDYDAITLQKLLTGKQAGASVNIGGLSESVGGASTPGDFETMMQLVYLKFEKPRFDPEVHNSIMQRNYAAIASQENNPKKIMSDSLQLIRSNYNPRTLLMNNDYLDQISLEQIEEIYRDRIKDISDFTFFIVGNIDAETVKPMVEKYLGSVTSHNRKESWRDNNVEGPKGKTEKVIPLQLETEKTTVFIEFSKKMKYNLKSNIYTSIIKSVLDLRYMENIREKEGGTYGVAVQASISRIPKSSYGMIMQFDCDPDKAEKLKSLIYVDVEKLMKEGPTQEELEKVTSVMLKNREQSKPHNDYWQSVLETYYTIGINTDDPKNYENIIKNVKPKDIKKFANQLFSGADIIDAMFVPKK